MGPVWQPILLFFFIVRSAAHAAPRLAASKKICQIPRHPTRPHATALPGPRAWLLCYSNTRPPPLLQCTSRPRTSLLCAHAAHRHHPSATRPSFCSSRRRSRSPAPPWLRAELTLRCHGQGAELAPLCAARSAAPLRSPSGSS